VQPPLLAGAVRHVLDLPAPDGIEDAPVRPALEAALAFLSGPDAGPVHLNVRFDKPLEPPEGYVSPPPAAMSPSTWHASSTNRTEGVASTSDDALQGASPGIVVVGTLPLSARAAVSSFVARLGWPVVADVTSGLSLPTTVVRLPTLALRSPRVRAVLRPRSVLWLGGLTTEDAVPLWLETLRRAHGCRVTLLTMTAWHRDPFDLADDVVAVTPERLALLAADAAAPDAALTDLVRRVSAATQLVRGALDDGDALSEPAIARAVLASVRPRDGLFLGNSMPVRDADRFGDLAPDVRLIVNRGAAGIDGCIATAVGACLATRRPTTALLGDLAVLHDLSSLAALAAPEFAGVPLRVVVVNNAGGGIFSFLPVGASVDAVTMRRFFETPHAVGLARVAGALGLKASQVRDLSALRERLAAPPDGPELLELVTDRRDNVAVHRLLDEQLEAAVGRVLEPRR
jgi:2-succinyl-5-enolpyruvyl-6-hydroxy-3-cyclohexene-1-carboxylate synthase